MKKMLPSHLPSSNTMMHKFDTFLAMKFENTMQASTHVKYQVSMSVEGLWSMW